MDRIWVGLDRVTLTSANKPPHTRPQQLHRHRQARLRVAVAWEEDRITMCKDSILIDVNIREWGAQWKQKDASTSELVTITWSRHILLRDLWRFYDLKDKLWVFGQEFLHLFFFSSFFWPISTNKANESLVPNRVLKTSAALMELFRFIGSYFPCFGGIFFLWAFVLPLIVNFYV